MASDNRDSVCDECARRMGWQPKDKVVGTWTGKCDFCGEFKPLTSLHHDWRKKGNEYGK